MDQDRIARLVFGTQERSDGQWVGTLRIELSGTDAGTDGTVAAKVRQQLLKPLRFHHQHGGTPLPFLGAGMRTNRQCYALVVACALREGALLAFDELSGVPGWERVNDTESRKATINRLLRPPESGEYLPLLQIEKGVGLKLATVPVVIIPTDQVRFRTWIGGGAQRVPTALAADRGDAAERAAAGPQQPSPAQAERVPGNARDLEARSSSSDFFNALTNLKREPIAEALAGRSTWQTESTKKMAFLIRQIERATSDIRVIAYSLAAWKDQLDEVLRAFLKRSGRLRVLMLAPDSSGFFEKTAMEAFSDLSSGRTVESWQRGLEVVRASHRRDIASGRAMLARWQSTYGTEQLQARLYEDTPNFYGFLIDDRCLSMSSYFMDPIERGFRLPVICSDENATAPELTVIRQLFRNWFDIKFAAGGDALVGFGEENSQ